MYLRAGQFECYRGRIAMPLTGTWVADLNIDSGSSASDIPYVGQVTTLSLGENGFTLSGTFLRINNAFGTIFARLVGGGGGLYETVGPKAYQGATFGLILNDLLNSVGETLSGTTPAAITNTTLPFWTVPQSPMFEALANLVVVARVLTSSQVNWRMLPDGTIFIGVEAWPQSPMTSFDLYRWQPEQMSATIFALDPRILPGQTWQSGQVCNVEHRIDPNPIRSTVWFRNSGVS